jgi:SPP1 family predicted phage head-tail adaptor
MTTRPGDLRRRIQIQQRSMSQDSFGQQSTVWTTIATVWAEILPVAGTQLDRARSVYNETSHQVTVRWQPFLENIKLVGTYRLLYAGRFFDVGASMNEEERNRFVTLLCKEGLNEGG